MNQSRTRSELRVSVIHPGARLHYAVPAILARSGVLCGLYTDAHSESLAVRIIRDVGLTGRNRALQRLLGRKLPDDIPRRLVRTWIHANLRQLWFDKLHAKARKSAAYHFKHRVGGHWLAEQAIRDRFMGANAVYIYPCSATRAIAAARRRGLFVIMEAISPPFNMRTQVEEYARLGLTPADGMEEAEANIEFFRAEAVQCDLVLAASMHVVRELVELGVQSHKIALVPYGLDAGFVAAQPRPERGRVLFVGTIDAHKGLAYYAEAARLLRARGFSGEFRAVGPHTSSAYLRDPAFKGLSYIGQVPRASVASEFAKADVFVFPTLTDGFGLVLLEALFYGLPIVCTPNCGDVVRDGVNGHVVPARSAVALAQAIESIVEDRAKRESMSQAALELRAEFTLGAYGRRLLDAMSHGHRVRTRGTPSCALAAQSTQAGIPSDAS